MVDMTEAVVQGCSVKKLFLEISQNSQETPVPEAARATLLKKRLWHKCFPVNFAKFLRTPLVVASVDIWQDCECTSKIRDHCTKKEVFY